MAAHDERHCTYCGGALLDRTIEGRTRRACLDAKVLLIKRSIEPFRGHWTLPAGYLEIDEEPWEAARRETREETGLEIEQVELLGVLTNRDDHRRNGIVVAYLARPVGGELAAGDDAEDARFFEMSALPPDLGFLNNRRLLETLARRLSSGGRT